MALEDKKVDCVIAVPLRNFSGTMAPTTTIMKCSCGQDVLVEAVSRFLISNGAKLYCLDCCMEHLRIAIEGKKDA